MSRLYLFTLLLHDFYHYFSSLSRLLSTASPQCFAILLNSFNRSTKYNKIKKPHAADCSDWHIDWDAAQRGSGRGRGGRGTTIKLLIDWRNMQTKAKRRAGANWRLSTNKFINNTKQIITATTIPTTTTMTIMTIILTYLRTTCAADLARFNHEMRSVNRQAESYSLFHDNKIKHPTWVPACWVISSLI